MLPSRHRTILAAALICLGAVTIAAADSVTPPSTDSPVQNIASDTAGVLPDTTGRTSFPDTAAIPKDSSSLDSVVLEPTLYQYGGDTILVKAFAPITKDTTHRISPTRIMFQSVVFPGWGQWSNRKYIKAGVVFAVESYFIYKYVHFARKASDWRTRWLSIPDTAGIAQEAAFKQYSDYRDSRNSNLWGTAVTIFLSMFDAYVDAHLRDFPPPVAGQTTVSWKTAPGNGAAVVLTYHF
jgi:hypothetical protein